MKAWFQAPATLWFGAALSEKNWAVQTRAPHHAVPPSTEYQRNIIIVMVFLTRNTLAGRISISDSTAKCRDVIVVAFELHTTNELTTTNIEMWPISHAAGGAHAMSSFSETKRSFSILNLAGGSVKHC